MNNLKQIIRDHFGRDFTPFFSRFVEDLKPGGAGNLKARCPFHDDKTPSLSISIKDGRFNCKACGAKGDIFTFYGKKHGLKDFRSILNDIGEDFGISGNGAKPHQDRPPKLIQRYDYTDAAGTPLFFKNRYDPKGFSISRPNGSGGYISGMGDVQPVLYNRPEVLATDLVFVVEGEKDANNLNAIDLTATCNFDGAGKWRDSYTKDLAGKAVVIVPDDDEPGQAHAQLVANSLHGVAASVKVLELPNPAKVKGFDISDWLAAQSDQNEAANQLLSMAGDAPEWAPDKPAKPTGGIEIVDAAEWLSTEPPPPDQILEDVLDTGDKLAVVAPSKQRKSFFFEQLGLALASKQFFLKWKVPKPRRVLYVQFELRKHHCHRRTLRLARAMGIKAEDLGGRLKIISARGLGLNGREGLNRIMECLAGFSPEVIMLDPLYKITQGAENAAEDFKVILNAFDELAERTGAAILYIHHDAKGAPGDKDIRDRGAGSGVLGRDYDACITLTAHAKEPDAVVVDVLLRNYPPQEPFTIVWECQEVAGGYCFCLADSMAAEKKTSKTRPPLPPIESYLPAAIAVFGDPKAGGAELEVGYFKTVFKERTGLSDNRIRDFINWATGSTNAPLQIREQRGRGLYKRWILLKDGARNASPDV